MIMLKSSHAMFALVNLNIFRSILAPFAWNEGDIQINRNVNKLFFARKVEKRKKGKRCVKERIAHLLPLQGEVNIKMFQSPTQVHFGTNTGGKTLMVEANDGTEDEKNCCSVPFVYVSKISRVYFSEEFVVKVQ